MNPPTDERLGDDGHAEGKQHCGPNRLYDPGCDQPADTRSESTEQRCEREHTKSGRVDLLLAKHVPEPADAESERRQREQTDPEGPVRPPGNAVGKTGQGVNDDL